MSFFSCKLKMIFGSEFCEYEMVNGNMILSTTANILNHPELSNIDRVYGFWEKMDSLTILISSASVYNPERLGMPDCLIMDDCYYKVMHYVISGKYCIKIIIYFPDEKHDMIRSIIDLMNIPVI